MRDRRAARLPRGGGEGRHGQGAVPCPTAGACRARTSTRCPTLVATYGAKGVAWARLTATAGSRRSPSSSPTSSARAIEQATAAPSPAACSCSWPTRREGGERLAGAPAAEARRPARHDSRRTATRCCGSPTSRSFEYSAGGQARGVGAPSVHRADGRGPRPPRVRSVRGARQGLRRHAERHRARRRQHPYPPPGPAGARLQPARHRATEEARGRSASCSTRWPTARRRTAASPSASTAWPCC